MEWAHLRVQRTALAKLSQLEIPDILDIGYGHNIYICIVAVPTLITTTIIQAV
jgi:hypothetical protein